MSVCVVIVGINQWEEYTKPLIMSIQRHEPTAQIVIVDNASQPPYPQISDGFRVGDIYLTRIQRSSYPAANNAGIAFAEKWLVFDWILIINNDVTCEAPFIKRIEAMRDDTIYGAQIIEERGHTWLGIWLALIPVGVWDQAGTFDEGFKMCGFEDADYCMRAKELGIDTMPIDLPFIHHWGKTRWDLPGYNEAREGNINYFEQKHGWRPGQNMRVIHG
jgi:GT2 family glycosyltransferase